MAARDWRNSSFAQRLEHVRVDVAGVDSYAEFRRRLREINEKGEVVGFDVHYNSVINYHTHTEREDRRRDPSLDYLRRVSQVFGIRMEWLMNGALPVTYNEELVARAAAQAAPDVAEGFTDGLGVPFEGLAPGTRAVLLQTWAVAMPRRTLPTYSVRYGSREKRTARMVGKAVSEALRVLDLQRTGEPAEAFLSGVSLSLAQLLRAEVAPWPTSDEQEDHDAPTP